MVNLGSQPANIKSSSHQTRVLTLRSSGAFTRNISVKLTDTRLPQLTKCNQCVCVCFLYQRVKPLFYIDPVECFINHKTIQISQFYHILPASRQCVFDLGPRKRPHVLTTFFNHAQLTHEQNH